MSPAGTSSTAVSAVRASAPCRTSARDRYKEALRELVEAKTKGLATTARAIAETP